MFLAIKKCLWLTSRRREIIHRRIGHFVQLKLEKFVKYFFGRVRIHFSPEKIYGRAILFFTRFMPTNGFIQPFVGIISFLSVKDGRSDRTWTDDLYHPKGTTNILRCLIMFNKPYCNARLYAFAFHIVLRFFVRYRVNGSQTAHEKSSKIICYIIYKNSTFFNNKLYKSTILQIVYKQIPVSNVTNFCNF